MKTEQAEGLVEKVAGKAQKALGGALDDDQMQAEGAGREAGGQIKESYGDALEGVSSFVKQNPIAAVAIATGVGILISKFLNRS